MYVWGLQKGSPSQISNTIVLLFKYYTFFVRNRAQAQGGNLGAQTYMHTSMLEDIHTCSDTPNIHECMFTGVKHTYMLSDFKHTCVLGCLKHAYMHKYILTMRSSYYQIHLLLHIYNLKSSQRTASRS